MAKFVNVDENKVKQVLGNSTVLMLCINALYAGKVDLNTAKVYYIPKADLLKDENLRSVIFGRVNSIGTFKGTSTTVKILERFYSHYAVDVIDINTFDTFAKNYSNFGVALEYWYSNSKHGSMFQDRVKKQDIRMNGHYIQCKCSLATERTKGSFATTNN